MGKVIYSMGTSLDGFVKDERGDFAFTEPDEGVHEMANELTREASAFLLGRRMYEVLEGFWPAAAERQHELPPVEAAFARAYVRTPRIVFSDTLDSVPAGTRLVRSDDAAAEVARLKAETDGPLSLGGAALAASLVEHIDEFRPWVSPVAVGGGTPFFPAGRTLRLRLVEHRSFPSGALWLRYERAG